MNFIGGDTGFGYINASSSASFNGVTNFQLIGAIAKNDNNSYLFLESKNVSGNIQEGEVTVLDYYSGLSLEGYTSNIVKVGDKYFLVFGEANNEGNENYPNVNAQPPGGHLQGYENGVPLPVEPDEGGDTGDGGDTGGDNQGGGETTPPSSDPIYNAIYEALDGSIINNNNLIRTAASTVEKQIETMQDERKTYQGSLIYHNMLGRIAHLSSRNNNSFAFNRNTNNYALNTKSKFASLASDYKPYYVNLEEQESNNVYISALAGYSNYKNSSGSEFGVSFGYDKEIVDEFFAGLSSIHKGDYKRHNIGAQARLGYRFEFQNENSLKPYLGILSSYYNMPEYKENGLLPISRSTNTFTSLYGVLGIEYRKILDSGSFFISLEGVNGKAVFGDKNYEMSIGQERISYENEKELFANIFAGASFSMSKDFDISA